MRNDTLPARLDLERRALFAVNDACDVNFTCREGTVWLTLDGDQRDYVLEAGDSFRTHEHRQALLYALAPARVDLVDCPGGRPVLKPWRAFKSMPAISAGR